ncbi:hypothetical protein F990_02922 [Acinetobacter tjernbergiae DSM 14971 = CIP 107465]|uniref:Uncharacterized protein n=1 Tax=Acinetobacter tjernbergiae DSM 14971 = CIP 107465 TaxID=1120928 RepID=V2UVV8_9GAMM|nr:hypothetical protein [Acinetobacter tjernbergiae]ESK54152.1 hypothetical protein F990_02922 [Acinetobacter tjernbergiae DSM 14971 = CIP 107465]
MSHFFKTELGQNALQQRDNALTARQRRLLLLIDHEDFQELDHGYKERIAPTELVQQLIDMGLLAHQPLATIEAEEVQKVIQPPESNVFPSTKAPLIPEAPVFEVTPTPSPSIESEVLVLEKLPFVEIQQVMIQTLTTYCGLMARPLIQKIQMIKNLQQLKACQMQWITFLQESRIPSAQLNQTLKLINYSVQHL